MFGNVIAALNRVVPHDWARLLRKRLDATGTDGAPLNGLTVSGWQLTYSAEPNVVQVARTAIDHVVEERFSIGMLLDENGTVVDVVSDSAAWKAGIAPGMEVARVDGQPWSPDTLHRAIERDRQTPIVLAVEDGSRMFDVRVAANQGVLYPHLERNANPDLIAGILEAQITLER